MEKPSIEKALQESATILTLVTGTLPAYFYCLNRQKQFIFANKNFLGFIGFTGEELYGKYIQEIFTDWVYKLSGPNIDLALTGQSVNFVLPYITLDGNERLLNTFLTPFAGIASDERVIGVFAQDITEQQQARENIERLNRDLRIHARDLERVNKELEAFSYSVSHDLRAPLRSIDGFSQALLEDYYDKLEDDGKDYLNRVRAATQKMGLLIDDLLLLSRINRGELVQAEADLSELVWDIFFQLKNEDPGRTVEFMVEPGLKVKGDVRLLRSALENLLRNAWKFTTRQAKANIEVGSLLQENLLVYYVRDNGIGFDMTYSHKLFGAFQRLHNSADFPGTGVGLAIVQRIIHRHGGNVWAESQPGLGASFYFTLS